MATIFQPNSDESDFLEIDEWYEDAQASAVERMETTMYSAMMKTGSYRIDYMNKTAMGTLSAIGLYVVGDLSPDEKFSRSARRALLTGLLLVKERIGIEYLVAVYLDINSNNNPARPAYKQMKADMRAGMFRRVFVEHPSFLTGSDELSSDWWNFYRELPLCEVWTFVNDCVCQAVPQAIARIPTHEHQSQPVCV